MLLLTKETTSEDLLYSKGNSTQYFVTTYEGKEPEKKKKGGYPGGLDGKDSASNAQDLGFIPGWEDALEKGIVTHSSILAWRIPWTKGHGGLRSLGLQRPTGLSH